MAELSIDNEFVNRKYEDQLYELHTNLAIILARLAMAKEGEGRAELISAAQKQWTAVVESIQSTEIGNRADTIILEKITELKNYIKGVDAEKILTDIFKDPE